MKTKLQGSKGRYEVINQDSGAVLGVVVRTRARWNGRNYCWCWRAVMNEEDIPEDYRTRTQAVKTIVRLALNP